MNEKNVIAIDGGAGMGKSTLAKKLAKKMGYLYMETGAMYRAVTLFAIEEKLFKERNSTKKIEESLPYIKINFTTCEKTAKNNVFLNGKNITEIIHKNEISEKVATVAKIKAVRDFLLTLQREIAKGQNIVMDGRDIGTVVFPTAQHKFFITVPLEIRAERRYKQLTEKGEKINFKTVLEGIKKRDEEDINRKIAPLKKAKDAIEIDNGKSTVEKTVDLMYEIIKGL